MSVFGDIPQYKRWTDTAIECYLRGCICEGCLMKYFFDNAAEEKYKPKCQMKRAVIQLVKNYGSPSEEYIRRLIEKDYKNATNTAIQ